MAARFLFDNVIYEPIKFAVSETPPVDLGIMFGYRFKNSLSISSGAIQETAQLLYVVSYMLFDRANEQVNRKE